MVKHPIGEANESSIFGSLTEDEFYHRHSVTHSSEFITNSRGLNQFTHWWFPKPPTKPTAVIAVLHGFTGDSDWFVKLNSAFFAESGFIVCALDYQGHGLSEGLEFHIPDINPIIDDCIEFIDRFREKHAPDLPAFIYGESLGAAIALYITFRQKGAWDGIVLASAMCGISRQAYPPWPLEHLGSLVARFIPTWRVIPTEGMETSVASKEEWKRKLALARPWRMKIPRLRVATALEILRLCNDIQGHFEEVEVPFLIVHGELDGACDPECVKELYKRASSKDKTITIYPDMWHQLVIEPQENVDLVFGDIVDWIKTRTTAKSRDD
ncbi:caffeoylshikimate esterase-like [Rutidosis leptorrhynchoides]|uniref:caffeoylshikimate esterase-like n=1 Tax=Rutidosis leptorrhynchoides TaxID=125765 RepID=UPI003A98D198